MRGMLALWCAVIWLAVGPLGELADGLLDLAVLLALLLPLWLALAAAVFLLGC